MISETFHFAVKLYIKYVAFRFLCTVIDCSSSGLRIKNGAEFLVPITGGRYSDFFPCPFRGITFSSKKFVPIISNTHQFITSSD